MHNTAVQLTTEQQLAQLLAQRETRTRNLIAVLQDGLGPLQAHCTRVVETAIAKEERALQAVEERLRKISEKILAEIVTAQTAHETNLGNIQGEAGRLRAERMAQVTALQGDAQRLQQQQLATQAAFDRQLGTLQGEHTGTAAQFDRECLAARRRRDEAEARLQNEIRLTQAKASEVQGTFSLAERELAQVLQAHGDLQARAHALEAQVTALEQQLANM